MGARTQPRSRRGCGRARRRCPSGWSGSSAVGGTSLNGGRGFATRSCAGWPTRREDLEFLRSLGLCSSLVIPIRARDRNLGALTLITAWSGRRYSAEDVRFAQILASRIGLALDNAGLFSDLESIERRMDTVMSILDEAIVIHGADGEHRVRQPGRRDDARLREARGRDRLSDRLASRSVRDPRRGRATRSPPSGSPAGRRSRVSRPSPRSCARSTAPPVASAGPAARRRRSRAQPARCSTR